MKEKEGKIEYKGRIALYELLNSKICAINFFGKSYKLFSIDEIAYNKNRDEAMQMKNGDAMARLLFSNKQYETIKDVYLRKLKKLSEIDCEDKKQKEWDKLTLISHCMVLYGNLSMKEIKILIKNQPSIMKDNTLVSLGFKYILNSDVVSN